jgi:dTDP-4-dehydrorhamnose 3,5-epimerase/CDP-3, 6-dideoxy-D-glycero-D-glycero-4-hexulose-5-epimerase|tara:strand:+ start:745 stop:1257 length:513 start_codon:yes stop_codon:yes gene_type:complete
MKKTLIKDLYIIKNKKFFDLRGSFIKSYEKTFFKKNKLNFNFKECFYSSSKKNVIRGIHYQCKTGAAKFIFVTEGKILDLVVDLRKNSKTYKKIFTINLSENNYLSLYIPSGCGHAYKVLSKKATVVYLATKEHIKSRGKDYLWNSIDFDWKIKKPILSKKDKLAEKLKL